MVGILHSFPFGAKGLFSGANLLLVSGRVGIPYKVPMEFLYTPDTLNKNKPFFPMGIV